MCDQTGIGIGSELKVIAGEDFDGPYILMRPAEKHRSFGDAPFVSIDEIFAGYVGDYHPIEFDWGQDVGPEVIE
jgi:antitoxin MazE